MPNLNSTVIKMDGGVDVIAGIGLDWLFTVAGTWATGNTITMIFTDSTTAVQTQVGAGDVTGLAPTYCYTFDDKVYILAGAATYFSVINDPTQWNDLNGVGNGNVTMSNFTSTPESLAAIGHFQGKLAFISRQTTILWQVNANPDLWQRYRTMSNIGTFAPASVQSIGDLDVLMLSDTGIRSIRAKDNSAEAYVDDVGAPIDALIQVAINTYDAATLAAACAIVEPTSNRYWLFLGDKIYVLSSFASSKVQGWSIYLPTYKDGNDEQQSFAPEKFVIFEGQVFCRNAGAIFAYGGSNKNTYDNAVALFQVPWTEVKQPATRKSATGIDAAFTGIWNVDASMDIIGGNLERVMTAQDGSTFSLDQRIPYSSNGTHFTLYAETTGTTAAIFSSLVFHFEGGEEK